MGTLMQLDLAALRHYRATLSAEDDKVAYWRRVTDGRLDLLEAPVDHDMQLTFEDLVRVLGDTGTGRSRRGLGRASASLPLPPLPEAAEMWTSGADRLDPAAVRAAVGRLEGVQAQLGGYRHVLHQRMNQATDELISRYREDPRRALSIIPAE